MSTQESPKTPADAGPEQAGTPAGKPDAPSTLPPGGSGASGPKGVDAWKKAVADRRKAQRNARGKPRPKPIVGVRAVLRPRGGGK